MPKSALSILWSIGCLIAALIIAPLAAAVRKYRRQTDRLGEELRRMEALFQLTKDGLIELDQQFRIVRMNPAAETIFGSACASERSDIRALLAYQGFTDDWQRFYERLPLSFETTHLAVHGKRTPVWVQIVPTDPAAKATAVAIVRDISELKMMHTRREIYEQKYKSLFDNHPDAVFMLSNTGVFIDANPKAVAFSGMKESEFLGSSFKRFVTEEEFSHVNRLFHESLEGVPQFTQLTLVRGNGDRRLVDVTSVPIIIDNEIIGVYGICRDKAELQAMLETHRHESERAASPAP